MIFPVDLLILHKGLVILVILHKMTVSRLAPAQALFAGLI